MNYFITILLLSISSPLLRTGGDEPNTYKINDFTIDFYNAYECDCADSCGFSQKNDSYFIFDNAIKLHELGDFQITYSGKSDSIIVYQRFEYVYGILYSETEGVMIYDSTRLADKNQAKYVSYGKWFFRPADSYDNHKFYVSNSWEGKTVKGPLPKTNRKAAEDSLIRWRTHYDSYPEETMKYIKENKGLGLFINGIEIRAKIYQNGKIKRVTFYFPFRHGEC